MDASHFIAELIARTYSGINPGLERTLDLCAATDNPQSQYPIIHVGGTNGKGSVSAMYASVLQCSGLKVGLYTSPHIRRFNERIRVNGDAITDDEILEVGSDLLPLARLNGASFFEVTTVMAFRYFATKQVDVAVVEVGLGGRLDATNVVRPILSVITSIGLDHTDILGPNISDIAKEKSGIIKHGIPVVTGDCIQQAMDEITAVAANLSAPLITARDWVHVECMASHPDLSMTVRATTMERHYNFTTPLAGYHQMSNIATVLAGLPHVEEQLRTECTGQRSIAQGMGSVRPLTGLSARLQLVQSKPPIIVDVAHNSSGIQAMVDALTDCGHATSQMHAVIAFMADKDICTMLDILCASFSHIICCPLYFSRAIDVDELYDLTKERTPNVKIARSVRAALETVLQQGVPAVFCGSFHLADEFMEACDQLSLGPAPA